jgi:hypothetical protein
MALDPTIPLGVKSPDLAGSIGQWGQLGLLKNQLALSNNQVQLGNATLQPLITQAQALASTAVTNTEQAKFNLTKDQAGAAFNASGALSTHPAIVQLTQLAGQPDFKATLARPGTPAHEAVNQALIALGAAQRQAENMGLPPEMADVMFGRLRAMAENDPRGLQAMLIQNQKVAMGPAASAAMMFPPSQQVPTGQVMQPVAAGNQAMTGVQAGAPQGVPTPMEPPPTTLVFKEIAPGVMAPGILGANRTPGFIQTGPALGQAAAVEGRVKPNVEFFAGVRAAAAAAPQRIGVIQEIKRLAPEAITGNADWKRALISRIGGLFGASYDMNTATDEMMKNTAMLMNKAGATDAAREVEALMTPGVKITEKAVQNVSNSLLGYEKRNLAADAYFSGIPQDSAEFDKRFETWNNIPARDEVFKLDAMSLPERQEALNKLKGTPRGDEVMRGAAELRRLRLLKK